MYPTSHETRAKISELIHAKLGEKAPEFLNSPSPLFDNRTPYQALHGGHLDMMRLSVMVLNLPERSRHRHRDAAAA